MTTATATAPKTQAGPPADVAARIAAAKAATAQAPAAEKPVHVSTIPEVLAKTTAEATPAAAPVAAPKVTAPATPAWMQAIAAPEEGGPPQQIMLYGLPGRRKSTIAASIALVPGMDKVLYIDIDNGGSEVLLADPDLGPLVRNGAIQRLLIDPDDPNAQAKLDSIVNDVAKNDYGYKAVILDTLDVGQDVVERNAKVTFATSGKGGKQDGFAIWGEIGEWTNRTVRKLKNAPHFVSIVVVHAKEQTKDDGAYRVLPTLSGSSKDSIAGIPSLVAYLEFKANPADANDVRLVATIGEHEHFITKNRYRLPSQIVDLTLPKLYEMIEQRIAEAAALAA